MFKRIFFIAGLVLLQSCSVSLPSDVVVDPVLNEQNAAKIFVYRPSNDGMGVLIQHRVTIDENYIGIIEQGTSVHSYAEPGTRKIAVTSFSFGFLEESSFRTALSVEAGGSYYIRYSQHLGGVGIYGDFVTVSASVKLQQVSEEVWRERK